jgi:hypothetical protein
MPGSVFDERPFWRTLHWFRKNSTLFLKSCQVPARGSSQTRLCLKVHLGADQGKVLILGAKFGKMEADYSFIENKISNATPNKWGRWCKEK